MENKSATELRIIEVIDKYIIYMLTENDKEKIIYSKLLELEGEELKDWINDEFKDYLLYLCEYEDIESEDFMGWLNSVDTCTIFTDCGELMEIQRDIIEYNYNVKILQYNDIITLTYNEDLIQYYSYMYINEMKATELKEYIINLLDPVEPK